MFLSSLSPLLPLSQHLLHTAEPSHSRDLRAAAHWLHESARAGHTESQFRLAQQLEQAHPADAVELTRAYGWYRRAAQAGHAQAQYLLGLAYAENKPVVQAYYARPPTPSAVATPAVSQPPTTSPSSASSSSAASASSSSHLDRDQSAAKWFSRATDQGNVHAQARLGFALWNGVGVQPERGTAIMWLNNAAEAVSQTDRQPGSHARAHGQSQEECHGTRRFAIAIESIVCG